jgi:acyl carrier protein
VPSLHPMATRVAPHVASSRGTHLVRSLASVGDSPVLTEMCDHVVSGHAILPGAAHAEVGRGAAALLVSSMLGEVGVCAVVFAAPLSLQGAAVVGCDVDRHGGVVIGTPQPSPAGLPSLGMRSSARARAVVGACSYSARRKHLRSSVHLTVMLHVPAMGLAGALESGAEAGRTQVAPSDTRVVMSRVQMPSGNALPYHISPAVLHEVLQLGATIDDQVSRRVAITADSQRQYIRQQPSVPASIHGALMRGRQDRCADMWGSAAVERGPATQSSVMSHHRVWSKAGATGRCNTHVQSLQSKAMRSTGGNDSAHDSAATPDVTPTREASLGRTMYAIAEYVAGLVGMSDVPQRHVNVEHASRSANVAAARPSDQVAAPSAVNEDTVVVRHMVDEAVAAALGRTVSSDAPLMEEGLDSLSAVQLGNALHEASGVAMPATLMFDYPTTAAIAEYVAGLVAVDEATELGRLARSRSPVRNGDVIETCTSAEIKCDVVRGRNDGTLTFASPSCLQTSGYSHQAQLLVLGVFCVFLLFTLIQQLLLKAGSFRF